MTIRTDLYASTDPAFRAELLKAIDVLYTKDVDQFSVPKEHAVVVFDSISAGCTGIRYTDTAVLFCMYKRGVYSPHYVGEGVQVVAMLSSEYAPKLTRRFLVFLRELCKQTGCKWFTYNHKISTGKYLARYTQVR